MNQATNERRKENYAIRSMDRDTIKPPNQSKEKQKNERNKNNRRKRSGNKSKAKHRRHMVKPLT